MSVSAPSQHPAPRTWFALSVLFFGTLLLFSRSWGYEFLNYDDPSYVTNNLHVRGGLNWPGVVWAFTGRADYWHPLTWLTHMLDWEFFGDDPTGHRVVSVLWHALNAGLAFLLLRRLLTSGWLAFWAAALFAWHPLRIESVIWITERKDVMSGCFFLLTLLAYLGYGERKQSARPSARWYGLTLFLFSAGLMCKPVLVTLPLLLLVLDFWALGRGPATDAVNRTKDWIRLLVEKIPFFLLSLAAATLTVLMQQEHGAFVLNLPWTARLGNAIVSIARYLGNLFWPADLTVCYPHPGHWPWLAIGPAVALCLGISAVAWKLRSRAPGLAVGWLWFLCMLLPVLGLVQVGFQAMADRYTYLPMFGFLLGVLAIWRTLTLAPRVQIAVAGVTLGAAVLATWHLQSYWRDSLTLFQRAVAVTERNATAEGFLAYTHFNLGHLDEAETHSRRSLEIDPDNRVALLVLGGVEKDRGHFEAAERAYRHSLALKADDPQIQQWLGLMLWQQNRRAEALPLLRAADARDPTAKFANLDRAFHLLLLGRAGDAAATFSLAVAIDPEEPSAWFGQGMALVQLGKTEDALAAFKQVSRLNPSHLGALIQAGLLQYKLQRTAEAGESFQRALAIQPLDPVALTGLGRIEEQRGHPETADRYFAAALAQHSTNPVVLRAWAETLARRRRFPEAAEAYQRLLAVLPADAEAHAGLGYMLMLTDRRPEAVRHWQEALRLKPDFPGLRERLDRISR